MTNEEKILDMLNAMNKRFDAIDEQFSAIDERFDAIDERFNAIDEEIANLKESLEETRSGVNSLLEWAEECGNVIKFPLPKVK